MSAFIVSKKHIDALVAASEEDHAIRPSSAHDSNKLGQLLQDANEASVNYRYAHKVDKNQRAVTKYKFERPTKVYSPVQLLKAINCFDYQACELDDWKKSDAFAYLEDLKDVLIRKLPGYQDAAWEIA